MGAGFGAAAAIAVAFLMEDVPVVRKDIFMNLPIIGSYWDRKVAPEDNPF
jgi:Ubiquinol-cytochrome-c reductase complex subunit (QCR10)